jgi:hypothetical protein
MKKTGIWVFFMGVLFLFSAPLQAASIQENNPNLDFTPTPPPGAVDKAAEEEKKTLPGGYFKMSGRYRLAAGHNGDDFIVNDANADLQEKNFRYLFGEDLNNTYDPAIYSQHLVNIDFSPKEPWSFYTQIVNDPWSWVGQTGEQYQTSDIGGEHIRYNLKYFGANNSTIGEAYRTDVSDSMAFPIIKAHDGRLTPGTVVHGFFDFNPATGGIPVTIPELDLDFEYKPVRKLWMDYTEDNWHARIFALADQTQALSTDDPLQLSNHKDYWQQSPWLYQYKPLMHFTDHSVKRGYYDDALSFLARDSEGNRLVLLRGASVEAQLDQTYFAGTVAAPYTPWDEHYFDADNVPGAFRLKHQATDKLMVGGTYTFRTGLIDDSVADFGQVGAADIKYQINENSDFQAEFASSQRDRDLKAGERYVTSDAGNAYKAAYNSEIEYSEDRTSAVQLSYTQMDQKFEPQLSRYTNTRDDHFWGNHLTFQEYAPEVEHFRIGDGVDRNRMVVRAQWKEKLFKERFQNLFDIRNVHKTHNTAYLETVVREEMTYKINEDWTAKGLFRWHGLPSTTDDFEPYMANFYFVGFEDPASLRLQNVEVPGGVDADRFTYSGALQYVHNPYWTFEGFYERTNDVPDFPRGLMNSAFRDANDRIDGILVDRVTTFLYDQSKVGGVPPYDYFNIFRERIIFKPEENLKFIVHMAQNGYKFAGGIDDNVNHQGISVEFDPTEKIKFFFDYTHSMVIDLPKYIDTDFAEKDYRGHHNFYGSFDYKINAATVFRAEYGLFGLGANTPLVTPYSVTTFNMPTLDTEHLFRVSLTGDF